MIRLRPHHLLCMLTYVGKGYTPAFTANFDQLTRRIATGSELVEIVSGPDDVCAPWLDDPACHCNNESVLERDRLATEEIGTLLEQPATRGAQLHLSPAVLDRLRSAFQTNQIRSACETCSWKPLCDSIATSEFQNTILLGSRDTG